MVTVFEFLGMEPIENVVTCMNFRTDRCVFFGYKEVISRQKKNTEKFLKKYCHVNEVLFLEVPRDDLYVIEKVIRLQIEQEARDDSFIYFDLTGGEGLLLAAFGMLAKEFAAPMHAYDIRAGKLIDFDEDRPFGISHSKREQYVRLDLDRYIELRGGIINYSMHKGLKSIDDPEFDADVKKLWNVANDHHGYWTSFSAFLRENFAPVGLIVDRREETIAGALKHVNSGIKTQTRLNRILKDLSDIGVITEYSRKNDRYHFRFKNDRIKECLWDGGSILELHTFQIERERSDDCMMGVHLDWDGILQKRAGADVVNEIDVLSLNGYVPTFFSCKNGRMSGGTTLHALYELNSVAMRFGGKYARRVLVATYPLGDVYQERAREMGIEIR